MVDGLLDVVDGFDFTISETGKVFVDVVFPTSVEFSPGDGRFDGGGDDEFVGIF